MAVATATAVRVPARASGGAPAVVAPCHSAIPTSVRAFSEKNVTGTYRILNEFGENRAYPCPATIVMNANGVADTTKNVFTIPHSTMQADGVACTSNGSLDVLPSSLLSKASLMGDLGFTAVPQLTDTVVDALFANTRGFLLGIESSARTCGKTILPGGAAVLFVHEEEDVQLLTNLTLPGGAGVSYMGTIVPDKACIYVRSAEERGPGVTSGGGSPTNQEAGGNGGNGAPGAVATASPTATPESVEEDSCFPATATVRTADGSAVAMADLDVGTTVHVGSGAHSDIYAWSHKSPSRLSQYVAITTTTGEAATSPLLLSPSHYLYVDGELTAADDVRVGDELTDGAGQPLTVSAVERVTRPGLYAPHTLHGDLVVNGVAVSTYTRAVHPDVAHVLLAPLRLAYRLGVADPAGSWLYAGRPAGVVAALLPRGF
ncbi:hypothetical protein MMPV_008425 [Pyropia vietnamensis]